MTTISKVNSAALAVLQQANAFADASRQDKPGLDKIVAVANGLDDKISVSKQPTQAQSKISEAMFSVTSVDIVKMKLDLIDRTGKALGVDQADYTSREDFVAAIQRAVGHLKLEGGLQAVFALEKEIGLDKLGLSIDDVINSARDPDSDDKVTKALEKQTGQDGASARRRLQGTGDNGLYGTPNR